MKVSQLCFATRLAASPAEAWSWMVSVAGIQSELWPLMRMTMPRGRRDLGIDQVVLGEPLFTSWILLFGVIPIDRSRLTLVGLDVGRGFDERSPMVTTALWRHERWIEPDRGGGGCTLHDRLTFAPRIGAMAPILRWFVGLLFRHRHRVLARRLGTS